MSTSYSLAIHPECIEGIQLTKRNDRLSLKAEHSSAFIPMESEGSLVEKIGNFLEAHQWTHQPISLIIPTEEVSFRTIRFPFHDKKKIQQALPFEIQNEVLEEAEESYQYTTQLLPDGTTSVFLSLVPEAYLQTLVTLTRQHDLSIRNIDCAAHLLFKSIPPLKEDKLQFQVYLGAEETFINVIEHQHLQAVKIFSNRIAHYLKEYPTLHQIDPLVLYQRIVTNHERPNAAEEEQPSLGQAIALLQEEIQWLSSQFNLFLKTWQPHESIDVSLHGLFCTLIEWNGQAFCPKNEGSRPAMLTDAQKIDRGQEQGTLADNRDLVPNPLINSEEIGLDLDELDEPEEIEEDPAGKFEEKLSWNLQQFSGDSPHENLPAAAGTAEVSAHFSDFAVHWGILGELKKYGLYHLEGHGLSFYSEGTPFKRFFQKHRLMTAIGLMFLVLSLGSFAANYYLEIQLLEKEIALTEAKLQGKLQQLLPKDSRIGISAALVQLQSAVQQKKEDQQETRFHTRTYTNVAFIQRISDLLPEESPFIIQKFEFSPTRFSIKGTVDSYDNLEILKSGLASLEEFQDKKIIENNSNTDKGIFFTVSIDR